MYKESDILELKSEVTPGICKEIIAFANTKGGTIYIGYDDNSNLIGVKNVKEELDKLSNLISDKIDPNLIFNITMEVLEVDEKAIIIVKVLKGNNRPYYLKSKGMTSEGVYLRLGATNKQASRDDIIKMIMEDKGIKFEDNISTEQTLTFNALEKEFNYKNLKLDGIKMKNMGLLTIGGLYTNLAYILSDQNQFNIKIAVYKGDNKVEFLDKKELDNMSVFEQLYEIEKYLNLVIKVPAKIVGMKREEKPEYDIAILREGILNTIIHRDYSSNGPTLINIYENKIEIINIGGLVEGLSLDSIKKGSSVTRNPKLAEIFHRLNYIESYGSGIPRILAKYEKQEEKPIIEAIANTFHITLPKLRTEEPERKYASREEKILVEYILENGGISREEFEQIMGCSKATAARKIKRYINEKIIRQINAGRTTYYELF